MYVVWYILSIALGAIGLAGVFSFFEDGRADWGLLIMSTLAFVVGVIIQKDTSDKFEEERQARIAAYRKDAR